MHGVRPRVQVAVKALTATGQWITLTRRIARSRCRHLTGCAPSRASDMAAFFRRVAARQPRQGIEGGCRADAGDLRRALADLALDRSVSIQPSACGRVLSNWTGMSPQPIEVGWHFGVHHKRQPAGGYGPNRRCPRRDDDRDISRVVLTGWACGCQRLPSRPCDNHR